MTALRLLETASELPIGMRCTTSRLLPRVLMRDNPWADFGAGVHAFRERVKALVEAGAVNVEAARRDALAEMDAFAPHFELCEALDSERLVRVGSRREIAVAYDCMAGTAEDLGHIEHRAYPYEERPDSVYFGSADDVALLSTPRGLLVDIEDDKTGWLTEPAAESWQGKLLCLGFAVALGADRARFSHVMLREGMPPFYDRVEYDRAQLQFVADDLRAHYIDLKVRHRALERLAPSERAAALPPAVTGKHCRYCKSYSYCPDKVALAANMLGILRDLGAAVEEPEGVTMELVRTAFLRLEEIGELSAFIMRRLEGFAAARPVPIGDGRVMKMAAGRGTTVVNARTTIRALSEEFTEAMAWAAVPKTSQAAVKEAARQHARATGAPVGATQKRALEVIGNAGGITVEPGETKVRVVTEEE